MNPPFATCADSYVWLPRRLPTDTVRSAVSRVAVAVASLSCPQRVNVEERTLWINARA